MVSSSCCSFFASRPRKFGKSFFVNLLRKFFTGDKAKFEGTDIYNDPSIHWEEFPVIHLDMNGVEGSNIRQVERSLKAMVIREARLQGIELDASEDTSPHQLFCDYITYLSLKDQKKVVVIIDEYDSPVLSHLYDKEFANQCEHLVRNFYKALKWAGNKDLLRFRYFTGLTHFTLTDFGSGLNELRDIDSLSGSPYATLFGYTLEEVRKYCSPELQQVAKSQEMTFKEAERSFVEYYNGYNWHESGDESCQVLNPFSVNSCLDSKKLGPYWGERFVASWLKNVLVKFDFVTLTSMMQSPGSSRRTSLAELGREDVSSDVLSYILWECGLLTRTAKGVYFSNVETIEVFEDVILRECKPLKEPVSECLSSIHNYLKQNDIKSFFKVIEKIVNTLPNVAIGNKGRSHKSEFSYHLVVYCILRMYGGVRCGPEGSAGARRMDLWVATETTVFVIELKVGKSAKEALKQIRVRQYEKWHELGLGGEFCDHEKKAVGVSFSVETSAVKITTLVEDL